MLVLTSVQLNWVPLMCVLLMFVEFVLLTWASVLLTQTVFCKVLLRMTQEMDVALISVLLIVDVSKTTDELNVPLTHEPPARCEDCTRQSDSDVLLIMELLLREFCDVTFCFVDEIQFVFVSALERMTHDDSLERIATELF